MTNITIKHLDIDTKDELIDSKVYGNLMIEDKLYLLKKLEYTVEGDQSKTVTLEIFDNTSLVFNYELSSEYTVELIKFGIKNDGTAPVETGIGINNALKYAKERGCTKVIMPYGEYCISEDNPIIMVDNLTLDLNQSTFKINPNGRQKSSIVEFTGCKNAKLINGALIGDRYQHNYSAIPGSHEWNCAVVFNDCEYCEVENVTVKSVTGYGISSSLGKNISNLVIGVTRTNLQLGGITNEGLFNNSVDTIRTIQPMNISQVGGEFELGYNKGYMGYPFMSARTYDSFFYDKDMNLISYAKMCRQYKKVTIPQGAFFANFVFHQSIVPTRGDADFNGTTVFLTNYKSPYKIKIMSCLIEDNRCLGMGLCGGRDFLIENNTFVNNRGGSPGYAIDLEDGWEYMDKYLIKGNKFINNANDVVICAGDDIIFEGNHFTSTVYMWGRTTNYKFLNNKFEKINMNINYEYSTDTVCTGNTYINCRIAMSRKNSVAKISIDNETLINTLINSMNQGEELTDSTITSDANTSVRLAGSYRRCNINCLKGDYISANFYECKIQGTSLNCQGDTVFEKCEFANSISSTTSNTKTIKASYCKFIDSRFLVATWAAASILDIQNSQINMATGTRSFVELSAGKMIQLLFKFNNVTNEISKPVFNMFDASYSIPNGNATIELNSFISTKYGYIFDGVIIKSGSFNFIAKDNSIISAVMLALKYINNMYFIVK